MISHHAQSRLPTATRSTSLQAAWLRAGSGLAAFASLCLCASASAVEHPSLSLAGAYDMGTGSAAEIISVQQHSALAVVSNSDLGLIDVLSLATVTEPQRLARIELTLADGEELTSVSMHPRSAYCAVGVQADGYDQAGRVEFRALGADAGQLLGSVTIGIGPDAVAIDPTGRWCVIACEAEGYAVLDNAITSPAGSIAIVDLSSGPANASVRIVELGDLSSIPGITTGEHNREIERDIIDGEEEAMLPLPDATPAHLEPEYVAFSSDGGTAYISLQENNAIISVNVATGAIANTWGLGTTTHAADLVKDGEVAFTETLTALREPDGIIVSPDGRFLFTADEGDTDPKASKRMPAGGGRTMSVVDLASGAVVADTGNQLDAMAAAVDAYPDKRSEKKGSEPENIAAFSWNGETYAAVCLERASAVALVHVADDGTPTVSQVLPLGPDHLEPEGIVTYQASSGLYILTANEDSGTVAVITVHD